MFIDTEFLKNSEIKLVLERTAEGNEEKGWVPAYHFAILQEQKWGGVICVLVTMIIYIMAEI